MNLNIVDFISAERLRTYQQYTDRQERAIALHNHTLQLGASLMSMIALFELSLRNTTNQRLIEEFGDEEWLVSDRNFVPLKSDNLKAIKVARSPARKALYAKLSYKQKIYCDAFAYPSGVPADTKHETKVKKRQAMFVVTHGQVVAQTTFAFWKHLFSQEYEATLWKPCLKKVFPNKKLKRAHVSTALEAVYATRNRVAHHEPVYGNRLSEVIDALEFLRNALGARVEEEDTSFKEFSRIQYLRLRMDHQSFLEAWKTLT